MTVSLPDDKIKKITELCSKLLTMDRVRIRFLAEVIGVLVSSIPAVEHGELYYRFLETDRNRALKLSRGNYESFAYLEPNSKLELSWWIKTTPTTKRDIEKPAPNYFVTTDASLEGWGAVHDGVSCGGQWRDDEKDLHINVLELKAIFFGLKSFFNRKENGHIRIRCDNTTAVAYLNNKGGIRSLDSHKISLEIWEWAIEKKFHLSAEHIPGHTNDLADRASRVFHESTEWELDSHVFSKIIHTFGSIQVDLFASRLNKNTIRMLHGSPILMRLS